MKVIRGISRFFVWMTMFFIVALMLLMVAEVLLRSIFGKAILGSTEWACMLLLFELTSIGAAILSNRMIKVNMVTVRFSAKAQVILDIIMLTLCSGIIGLVAWRQFMFAMKSMSDGTKYITLGLPQWPFIVLFSLAYAVGAITTLCVLIRKIVNAAKGKWELEKELEDMDPVFVFGKHIPERLKRLMEMDPKQQQKEGGNEHES
ncbi:MAG: TRAP transporter small permease [Parasporobacterium sp.]|nr:TRAP transporter small permease [Parasporobacterium sp.]